MLVKTRDRGNPNRGASSSSGTRSKNHDVLDVSGSGTPKERKSGAGVAASVAFAPEVPQLELSRLFAKEENAPSLAQGTAVVGGAEEDVLDLMSRCGVKQRVRDIEHQIQAEVLTARQEIIRLELRSGQVLEEVAAVQAEHQKKSTAEVKNAQTVLLGNIRNFTAETQTRQRLLNAESARQTKQVGTIKQETRALKKLLRNLEKRVGKMETVLEFE